VTARILLCEDDLLAKSWLASSLRDGGFDVTEVSTVEECLRSVRDRSYHVAVVDVMMPGGELDWIETKGGFATGIAVARRLKQICPDMKIVGISQSPAAETLEWFRTHASGFLVKGDLFAAPAAIVERIRKIIDPAGWLKNCRTFIVHGHDHHALEALKDHLHQAYGFPPPTVLGEIASSGRTIIEKLDDCGNVDFVFVLMTPDEMVSNPTGATRMQARPNVLLETGYFLGRLARKSGRVIVLIDGAASLPSDLDGVGYIDISRGIAAASSEIHREIEAGLKC
jgi:predicted nucleotide-binding protein